MKTMNFYRKPYLAYLIGFMFLVVSCKQYDDGMNEDNSYKMNTTFNKEKRMLSDSDIIKIGEEHNSGLKKLLSDNPRSLKDIKTKALNLYSDKGLTKKMLNDYFDKVDRMNTNFLVDLIEKNKDMFVNASLLGSKILEIKNVKSIKFLKEHELKTRNELIGIDLDLYLVLTTVYQHSIKFWSQYFSNQHKNMDVWLEADGISASIGFFTMAAVTAALVGFSLATGGAGTIAVASAVGEILGIGLSSALASIYAAFK